MIKQRLSLFAFALAFAGFAAAQNMVTTYCGNGSPGLVNGPVHSAKFNQPFGMCIDKTGNLYVADAGNHCIRKISSGVVSTLAGSGAMGWKDGDGDTARFNSPSNLCVDDSGNVYVSDFANQRIRKVTPQGKVSTLAGTGVAGYTDGTAAGSQFNYPRGICVDSAGNLYVADSWNHRIRKITRNGQVITFAGGGASSGVGSTGALADGQDTSARFYTPSGLAIDRTGNLYVADAYNHRIRRVSNTGMVTGVCGTGNSGLGNGASQDGDSASVRLNTPTEVYVNEATGYLLIGETFGNRVRSLNLQDYSVSTYAGSGLADYFDDVDSLAAFNYPRGVVANATGRVVYVCDYNNHAIRMMEPVLQTSLASLTSPESLYIFPHPVANRFAIANLPEASQEIQIFSATGALVFQNLTVSAPSHTIDISSLPVGLYLLRVTTEGATYHQPLMKK